MVYPLLLKASRIWYFRPRFWKVFYRLASRNWPKLPEIPAFCPCQNCYLLFISSRILIFNFFREKLEDSFFQIFLLQSHLASCMQLVWHFPRFLYWDFQRMILAFSRALRTAESIEIRVLPSKLKRQDFLLSNHRLCLLYKSKSSRGSHQCISIGLLHNRWEESCIKWNSTSMNRA